MARVVIQTLLFEETTLICLENQLTSSYGAMGGKMLLRTLMAVNFTLFGAIWWPEVDWERLQVANFPRSSSMYWRQPA